MSSGMTELSGSENNSLQAFLLRVCTEVLFWAQNASTETRARPQDFQSPVHYDIFCLKYVCFMRCSHKQHAYHGL